MKQQSPKRQKRVFPLEKTMGAALQRRDKSLIGVCFGRGSDLL